MKVLIVGATGYVGTAVDEALSRNGHTVYGVARSDPSRSRLLARHTNVVLADAAKPQTLAKAAEDVDAIVYAVNVTDADPWTVDTGALKAIRKGLAGTEKTFVFVSSTWMYGATGDVPAAETAPINPPPLLVRRIELERATLEMTRVGIRSLIVRAGIAYAGAASTTWSIVRQSPNWPMISGGRIFTSPPAPAPRLAASATVRIAGRWSISATSAGSSRGQPNRGARAAPTTA
jgi:nucleoside-diphosphate-sugar epimerase